MTTLEILDGKLHLTVKGLDVILAFKRHLEIPLEHVKSAVVGITPAAKEQLSHSLRVPGTHLPGVLTAGSYVEHGHWMFWDVHHTGEHAITIDITHERYQAIVVDVEDPAATVAKIAHVLTHKP
jgi:hypothetical protein